MALQLPPDILVLIDTANADKETASRADEADRDASQALAAASVRKDQAVADSLAAHRAALGAATNAVNALLTWWDVQSSQTQPPQQAGPQPPPLGFPDQPQQMAGVPMSESRRHRRTRGVMHAAYERIRV
jgi:hypothetical protein